MARRLPPLKALYAFEAAGRLSSFTRAAEELGVTQGAVSKQISILEDYLGRRLFTRVGKEMRLTQPAAKYLASLTRTFDGLDDATSKLTGDKPPEILTVNILPSLSSRWLIPMLDDFTKHHPKYTVRIEIGDGSVDFKGCHADIAIRAGRRHEWKPLHAEPLMSEELLPVAKPDVLARYPVTHPRDFAKLTLLEHTTRSDMWREYLESMGAPALKISHTLGFEHFFMLIEAALDGLGVALVPRFLIRSELEQGRLTIAYSGPFKSPYRYYFICQKRMADIRKVRVFRSWLMEKARHF